MYESAALWMHRMFVLHLDLIAFNMVRSFYLIAFNMVRSFYRIHTTLRL